MTVQDHRADIQALVGSGFGQMRHADFMLLQLRPGMQAAACGWLGQVVASGLVRSCAQLRPGSGTHAVPAPREALSIAFTYTGLGRLGLTELPEAPFSAPFKAGMASPMRAALLGDGSHTLWQWGDVAATGATHESVDVLLAHYRAEPAGSAGGLVSTQHLHDNGWQVVARIAGAPEFISVPDSSKDAPQFREPFGFRDGLSQPVLKGLREPGPRSGKLAPELDLSSDHDIEAGEFVLGHRNEYGELAHCPNVLGWHEPARAATAQPRFGLNGSYLAVRQIVQDVEAFRRFETEHPPPAQGPSLAERMVGRYKDGRPLASCPYVPEAPNNFRYRVDDAEGFQCPHGAHIRRANPRDTLAWDVASGVRASKLHRLLRRGRVYARAPQQAGAGVEQGLFFVALNANLDRQFEFVQQRWIADNGFGELRSEDDPIVGQGPQRFTTQAVPLGRSVQGFAPFTQVVGGGYFFLPALSALAFMAQAAVPPR